MRSEQRRIVLQFFLFLTTFVTTTLAGADWTYGKSIFMPEYSWSDFVSGLEFSIPFLLFLTVHEFGHYFMAAYHKVKTTLPYYIPFLPLLPSIGTMGAVIRIQSRMYSKKQNFDVGLAGPLAGFGVALVILFYGFTHLPEPEYIYQFHPEYEKHGLNYAESVYQDLPDENFNVSFGENLLFVFFKSFVADPSKVPNPHEIMHYPYLFAGFLSLVFTALNLLPVGQLDGGHIVYGLFGFKVHRVIASVAFLGLLLYSGLGVISPKDDPSDLILWIPLSVIFLYTVLTALGLSKTDTIMYALILLAIFLILSWALPQAKGYPAWLVYVFVIGRFLGVQHPPAEIEEPLDEKRIILGWIALFIFIISFSPAPFIIK